MHAGRDLTTVSWSCIPHCQKQYDKECTFSLMPRQMNLTSSLLPRSKATLSISLLFHKYLSEFKHQKHGASTIHGKHTSREFTWFPRFSLKSRLVSLKYIFTFVCTETFLHNLCASSISLSLLLPVPHLSLSVT